MEKIFQLKKNGTTVRTEIVAGLTTFFTMAYIIFLNPTIIGKSNPAFAAAGYEGAMADSAVFTATCIGAALGTWLVGWLSNYPMAQAPGLGLNAVFAYTLCIAQRGACGCVHRRRGIHSYHRHRRKKSDSRSYPDEP